MEMIESDRYEVKNSTKNIIVESSTNISTAINDKSFSQAHIEKALISDRNHLITWSKMPAATSYKIYWSRLFTGLFFSTKMAYMQYHLEMGGAEKIAVMINNVMIDLDGDGKISAEEIKLSKERNQEMVERALSLLINSGIIAALILAVVFPLMFVPIQYQDSSVELFTTEVCDAFYYIYLFFLYLSAFLAILLIYISNRFYQYLTFWLPGLESKICWLNDISMTPIVLITMTLVQTLVLSVPFGTAVIIAPGAGLMAVIFAILFFIARSYITYFDLVTLNLRHKWTQSNLKKYQ